MSTAPTSILVIEDDKDIANIISFNLRDAHYEVDVSHDGEAGLQLALAGHYSLIILDLMLPNKHGLEICKALRQDNHTTPICMLTSLGSEMDRVVGLELGADDYLAKPFSIRELQARVRALLRRSAMNDTQQQPQAGDDNTLTFKNLSIDVEKRQVVLQGKQLELTAKEFDLLHHMASHEDKVFTRSQLLDEVWGYGHIGYEHTVNTHINRLRRKLNKNNETELVRTVWGVGYKFSESE